MIPTTKTATDKMDTSAAPYLDTYLTQLKTAKVRTPSANWGEIDTILGKAFEQVIRGEAEACLLYTSSPSCRYRVSRLISAL